MNYDFMKSTFIADATLAYIRAGHFPSEQDAKSLDRVPIIDALRQRVAESDIAAFTKIVATDDGPSAGFAASLLRRHVTTSEVRTCFEGRWRSASPYLKNRLMWRLLDLPDLTAEQHEMFRDFVFTHWDLFQDFNRGFFGPRTNALGVLVSRIVDPSFPASKKWAHLCCASAVTDDPEHARAVIQLGLLLPPGFAHDTALQVLGRFFVSKAQLKRQPQGLEGEGGISCGFVADAVVASLRGGSWPDDEEADWLNRLPIIDTIRARIRQSDLDWVWQVVESERGERTGLFLSLLKSFTKEEAVQARLQHLWRDANPFVRSHLMWRILDDPKLPASWHNDLFQFTLAEWNTFQRVSLKFLGSPQDAVAEALKRFGDPSFPESKKWAYLCRVPGVAHDQQAARALVSLGLQVKDDFTRKVAEELLRRFF